MTTNTKKTLDDLLTTLADQLAEPGHNLLPMLRLMGRFSKYSLANQLLIYAQRPGATKVLGFHSWRNTGYIVRKGEKGIAIYAPMQFRNDNSGPGTLANDPTDSNTRLGFRVAYLFDITQVEPLTGFDTAASTATAPITETTNMLPNVVPPAPLACIESLKIFLATESINLVYAQLDPGHYGFTDGKTITCAAGLAPHIEFATLIHETTHSLMHFDGNRPDITTRETEAEAVTYLICEQLRLADTQLSIDYIRGYRGTKSTLRDSLERIRATAQRLAAILLPDSTS